MSASTPKPNRISPDLTEPNQVGSATLALPFFIKIVYNLSMMNYTTYVEWGGKRFRSTWMPGAPMPPIELVTSVHGFCFEGDRLMLVDLYHRGLDIPGGHREGDEQPVETLRREVLEEGYAEGRPTYIGAVEIENEQWQPGGRYPRIGYQVLYRVDLTQLHSFAATHESGRRLFVDPADAPRLHHSWNPTLDRCLAAALAARG